MTDESLLHTYLGEINEICSTQTLNPFSRGIYN